MRQGIELYVNEIYGGIIDLHNIVSSNAHKMDELQMRCNMYNYEHQNGLPSFYFVFEN